jgi:hypothetical protein
MFDFAEMRRAFAANGVVATYEPGATYPLKIVDPARPSYAPSIADQYLTRIGLEFVAPSCIVAHQVSLWERFPPEQVMKTDVERQEN